MRGRFEARLARHVGKLRQAFARRRKEGPPREEGGGGRDVEARRAGPRARSSAVQVTADRVSPPPRSSRKGPTRTATPRQGGRARRSGAAREAVEPCPGSRAPSSSRDCVDRARGGCRHIAAFYGTASGGDPGAPRIDGPVPTREPSVLERCLWNDGRAASASPLGSAGPEKFLLVWWAPTSTTSSSRRASPQVTEQQLRAAKIPGLDS